MLTSLLFLRHAQHLNVSAFSPVFITFMTYICLLSICSNENVSSTRGQTSILFIAISPTPRRVLGIQGT